MSTLSHYLLILLVFRGVHGPQAELRTVWYHFGFVYSCPPGKTLVRRILLTLSKMVRERRMQIFRALGPDFELFETFFLNVHQNLSSGNKTRNNHHNSKFLRFFLCGCSLTKKIGLLNILNPGQRREGASSSQWNSHDNQIWLWQHGLSSYSF